MGTWEAGPPHGLILATEGSERIRTREFITKLPWGLLIKLQDNYRKLQIWSPAYYTHCTRAEQRIAVVIKKTRRPSFCSAKTKP